MRTPRIELGDVQGNVLRSYRLPHAHHTFVHLGAPAVGRALLGSVLGRLTDASPWSESKPAGALNVALSYEGLRALGVGSELLSSFPSPFREGMAQRAELLGDVGDSAPSRWVSGLGDGSAHVLVSVYSSEAAGLHGEAERLHREVAAAGATVVHERTSHELEGAREHFGFADGFSQPAVAGVHDRSTRGARGRLGRWRPLPAGEFVLGYRDAEGHLPGAPPRNLGRNSTYLVYRELAQDVAGFRRFVSRAAQSLGEDEEWVAARIVGRWRDGTPLALSPGHPDPRISENPVRTNDFDYGDDPEGLRCPLGAHVRRSNPRNGIRFGAAMTLRHRIIRRGMPYGSPLPEGRQEDDDEERGLVFMCFNADLVRQFEFVQREWCLDGNDFGLGEDHDPLIGRGGGSRKHTVQGRPPRFVSQLASFVTMRGGEYLFVPGRRALGELADGALCG